MSGEQKNGSPSGGPGKSLALMQQRLLTKPQGEEENSQVDSVVAGNASGQSTATTAAPSDDAAAVNAAQNRPKGKDFATMSMNAKTSSAPAPDAIPQVAQPNRPKGKDFAAMANRMPPQQVAPASIHPHDPARAAKMQAAARAAAGLPPLTQPTATSVTTLPPPITASVPAPRPVQPAQAPVGGPSQLGYAMPPQAAPIQQSGVPQVPRGPTPMQVDPRTQPVPRASQMSRSNSGGVTQPRRNSGSNQQQVPAPMAATVAPVPASKRKPSPKPTSQPTASESRLALSATSLGRTAGGPHVSPLVGQRLRDLVASLDPNYVLDAEAEEQVLHLADDFLDKVTRQSMKLAQHRGSRTLDIQDVQLALSKQWGIVVPGLGPPVLRPTKPANRASASSGGKRRASSSESAKGGPSKKAKTNSSTAVAKTL